MSTVTAVESIDIRFPTSTMLDGSDAMNKDPDYSAAYVRIHTDSDDGFVGHGFVFTIGRGNEIEIAAIESLGRRFVGANVEALLADMGATWRDLVHDSQPRWLGPEKGVVHMAIGALINALWDLKSKRAGLPLWRLLAEMTPQETVALLDFRYLTDALTPQEALEILHAALPGRSSRIAMLEAEGYPAYTTTPGWLGYDDEKLARLCREAVEEGFSQIKLKVGTDRADDVRRLGIARDAVGDDVKIAVDANQRWDVAEAIDWVGELARFDLAWVEEPTSPDDILGHAAISRAISPIPVASGEHGASRVMFKQFLQADALQILQMDATRVAGVNENIVILLLAAKFGVPVCPHAGGVGLCEMVQHFSMFDYVAVSATRDNRVIEYIDHLHEHFVVQADVHEGRYWPPRDPGIGAEMFPDSISEYTYRSPSA
jgi:L-fuconate dehydratase